MCWQNRKCKHTLQECNTSCIVIVTHSVVRIYFHGKAFLFFFSLYVNFHKISSSYKQNNRYTCRWKGTGYCMYTRLVFFFGLFGNWKWNIHWFIKVMKIFGFSQFLSQSINQSRHNMVVCIMYIGTHNKTYIMKIMSCRCVAWVSVCVCILTAKKKHRKNWFWNFYR